MTKPKPKDQLQKRGRKSDFRPEYILIAKACARFGAIEDEIANELNIGPATLDRWKQKYPEFRCALKAGKEASDDRVERSLYQLAIGWNGQPPYLGPVLAFPLAVARHQMQRFFGAYSFGFLPTKDQVVLPKHSIEKHGNLALVPCT